MQISSKSVTLKYEAVSPLYSLIEHCTLPQNSRYNNALGETVVAPSSSNLLLGVYRSKIITQSRPYSLAHS